MATSQPSLVSPYFLLHAELAWLGVSWHLFCIWIFQWFYVRSPYTCANETNSLHTHPQLQGRASAWWALCKICWGISLMGGCGLSALRSLGKSEFWPLQQRLALKGPSFTCSHQVHFPHLLCVLWPFHLGSGKSEAFYPDHLKVLFK